MSITPLEPAAPVALATRSPGRMAWRRLCRDRTALVSGVVSVLLIVVGLAAPLIRLGYGIGPQDDFKDDLDRYGMPYGVAGGISGSHWFGLEPGQGRDLFMQMVYGMRTSLGIAFAAALMTTAVGVLLGIVAGYVGGWVDAVINWVTDVTLALPFLIFTLAVIRPLELHFYGPREAVPGWFRVVVLIALFTAFGWTTTARLVRGQVMSLREREFVEAAKAGGARLPRILGKELLPNLGAPILVAFSLAIPAYITGEAALSFLGIGMLEPTPDFGRTIFRSLNYLQTDPAYVLFPGVTIFVLVLAFNLFGDALRDALDPKAQR
ncbi:ABC transporter permease [Dactylosporangium sp. NPDC049140]|uniref:ABC transporter permease n=1 Tax=Dactylosporangium sp. NPDC049140 TaxID=3155647 RepID=UPI0033DDABE4